MIARILLRNSKPRKEDFRSLSSASARRQLTGSKTLLAAAAPGSGYCWFRCPGCRCCSDFEAEQVKSSSVKLTINSRSVFQGQRSHMSVDVEQDGLEVVETREWLDSMDFILRHRGRERALSLLERLELHVKQAGVRLPFTAATPYINTIPAEQQAPF